MKLLKRFRQLATLLAHPNAINSRYDTPLDNIRFAEIRRLYDQNLLNCFLFEEFLSRAGIDYSPLVIEPRHLYDGHRTSGSISPLELKSIAHICQLTKPKTILEIGTFEGRTTTNLALACPGAIVYTMNLPQEECAFEIGKFFNRTADADRISQIFTNSQTFDFSELPRMDLIFIDGDHSYEGVLSDTENAFGLIADRGIILWHDFDTCHLGSTKAVLDSVWKHGFSYCNIEGTSLAAAVRVEPSWPRPDR